MTEGEIQKLGFDKEIISPKESGMDDNFHYYTYKIATGVEFITPANDEIENDNGWYVEFFDSDPKIRFNDSRDLQIVINIIEKSKVKR